MSAGDFAIVTGSGQAMPNPSGSAGDLDLGSITTDANGLLTETSAGVYRPNNAGYYLVIIETRFDTTHNNRYNGNVWIRRNGANVNVGKAAGYARNTANSDAYTQAQAILPFNGTTDTFQARHLRSAGAGTPAGTYGWTRAKVVQLTDGTAGVPYGDYGTPSSQSFSGTTPTAMSGLDVSTETDTSVIELQADTQSIRLKETGRPYLIVYCLTGNSTTNGRTTRVTEVTYDGNTVNHSHGYSYMRDSSNPWGHPNGMALVRPTVANRDVVVNGYGYRNIDATLWGTWTSANWTNTSAALESGVQVIALPSSTAIAIFEDTIGGVAATTSVECNACRSTVTADAPFTRVDNNSFDISTATDVMVWGNWLEERQASSGSRWQATANVALNNTAIANTDYGSYDRGEQGTQDTKNAASGSLFVGTATAGGDYSLRSQIVGDSGGNNEIVRAGMFAIDLSTLAAPQNIPAITDVDTDESIVENQTNVVLTGTDFESPQGTGTLELGSQSTYGGTLVAQSIDTWSDTSIQFDVNRGALSLGTVYAFVTNDSGNRNDPGFAVTLTGVPVSITDVDTDEDILETQTNVVVTGSNFLTPQGTGKIELGSQASYGGTLVEQTVDTWGNTSIQFDVVRGALDLGTVYVWVTNDDGTRNTTGFAVTLTGAPVTITNIEDEDIAQSFPVTVDGSNFGASQGTGIIRVSDSATIGAGTEVQQNTGISWSDSQITFTMLKGAVAFGTAYVYIRNDDGTWSNAYTINIYQHHFISGTDQTGDTFDEGTLVTVTGDNFDSDAVSTIEINTQQDGSGSSVVQSTTTFTDTTISFVADLGALGPGTRYLIVRRNQPFRGDTGPRPTDGYQVTVNVVAISDGLYKTSGIVGTINAAGFTTTVFLIRDDL